VTPKEAIAILDGTTNVKSAEDFLAMLMALTKQGKVRAIILTEEESAGIASLLRSQQAEAASMGLALETLKNGKCPTEKPGGGCSRFACPDCLIKMIDTALATSSGTSLLSDLAALREVAGAAEALARENLSAMLGALHVALVKTDEQAVYNAAVQVKALDAALAKLAKWREGRG
jgi:hypothetical protein